MRITIVKSAGFCFGVKRAVEIAFDIARKKRGGVYTFGPIIHNPQVVASLAEQGVGNVNSVEELAQRKAAAVIIRTHGVSAETMDAIRNTGAGIVDATCPFVKKAQQYAKLLKDERYMVVVLGDREHPEVQGIMGYAGEDAVVVSGAADLPKLKTRVGVVVQTTQRVEKLKELVAAVVERAKEIKVYNTICNSTSARQRETKDLAGEVDVMIVVGGKNSANTTKLATLCESLGVPTYHIETADELRDEWFRGAGHVGITAGASTPDWIIKEIKEGIIDIGGSHHNGN